MCDKEKKNKDDDGLGLRVEGSNKIDEDETFLLAHTSI